MPTETDDGDENGATVDDKTGKRRQFNPPSSEGGAKPSEPKVPTKTDDDGEIVAPVYDNTGKPQQINTPSSEGGAKPSEPKVPTKTDDDGEIVAPVYDNPGKPQQINTPSSEGGAKEEASTWDKDSEQKVVASKKDSSPRKTTDTASKGDSSNDEIVPVKQVSTKSSSLRKKVNTYFVRDEISIDPSLLGLLIPQDNEGSLMTMGVNRNDLKEHNVGEIVYSILNRPGAKDEDEIIIKHGMGDLCKDKAEAVIWTLNKEQMTEENNVSKRLHVLTAKFLF